MISFLRGQGAFIIFHLPNISTKEFSVNNYHILVGRNAIWENRIDMLLINMYVAIIIYKFTVLYSYTNWRLTYLTKFIRKRDVNQIERIKEHSFIMQKVSLFYYLPNVRNFAYMHTCKCFWTIYLKSLQYIFSLFSCYLKLLTPNYFY